MSQKNLTYANLDNLKFFEELYTRWLKNPDSVDDSWRFFFDGMQFSTVLSDTLLKRTDSLDLRIFFLINAYRTYGHLFCHCDITQKHSPLMPSELDLKNFSLSESDLSRSFPTLGLVKEKQAPLKKILEVLKKTYCQTIGIEYMDLGSVKIESWIQNRIEPEFPSFLTDDDRLDILTQLNQAEGFEAFLHTKYVGQKRFSLEGAEAFIPTLHALLQKGGDLGVSEVVLGMAHRGRLNVLANIMGKSYGYIFKEFEDCSIPELSECSGDVKYHMGFSGTYTTKKGRKIQVILSANPSHLESVNPVVEGAVRAIQEQKRGKSSQKEVVPILIHGDAALAGQGVVYETMGFKGLNGYSTKGTIHIVINNQIGFTTLPKDGRSTRYCTDISKAFGSPVLHVNGEDPEACVKAAHLAIELRQEFSTDVFIDLMSYRKYGHNESDEPAFTQPLQYQWIHSKKTVRKIYQDRLIKKNILSEAEAGTIEKNFRDDLVKILNKVKSEETNNQKNSERIQGKHLSEIFASVETKVDIQKLKSLGLKLNIHPEGINLHPKISRLLKDRRQMFEEDSENPLLDWGTAEMLTYATLATEGTHIRLSGQDVRRGTFSHRHAFYVDQESSAHYFPLSHLSESQAPVDVFNSSLSEYAVMGFEFGYSLMYPKSLVLWEGQFGDFSNGAQIIIDQYIASSEMKWGHSTNLTLLLPHGYEGMGPDHSSAKIERFLQLCAEENLIVVNCSTPAQLFHLLRRQVKRLLVKPLIIFTPKALLRHPMCRSSLHEFSEGQFNEVLVEEASQKDSKRILFCSGKIYYDLLREREKRQAADAIIRIEQLYPLHEEKIKEAIALYPSASQAIWVQEEHRNMGAYTFIYPKLERLLEKIPLSYVGRVSAASTAAGSSTLHKYELSILFNQLYEGI